MSETTLNQEHYQATEAYRAVANVLKRKNYTLNLNWEALTFPPFTIKTDNLDIKLTFSINKTQKLILLTSVLPFSFPQQKAFECEYAINLINYYLLNGHFYYDYDSSTIYYIVSNCYYFPQGIRPNMLKYENIVTDMLEETINTIDKYDDLLLNLALGAIDLTQFIQKLKECLA